MPSGVSQTHVTPGPPGLSPSVPVSSNVTVPSPFVNSSSALLRPIGPTAPVPSNPAIQQQTYPSYPSVPPMLTTPQGLWLQPQQMSGLPRPPLLPHPAALPGPFPLSTHGMQLPYVPLPDSQPPGVTPVGIPGGSSIFSAASGKQSAISSVMEPELPPGIGMLKKLHDKKFKCLNFDVSVCPITLHVVLQITILILMMLASKIELQSVNSWMIGQPTGLKQELCTIIMLSRENLLTRNLLSLRERYASVFTQLLL